MGWTRGVVWGAVLAGGLAPLPAAAMQPASSPRLVWRLDEPARGIPAFDNQSVYFLSNRHELVAASVTSGRVRWRVPMESTGATFGSRVLVEHDVVVGGDYNLMGVSRRTGRVLWRFAAGAGEGTGVHLGGAAGGLVFTGSLAGGLHAVVAANGAVRWTVRVGDPAVTTVYSPVAWRGLVAAAFTDFGPSSAGGVIVVEGATGRVRWRRLVPGSVGASGNPVFAGNQLLVASRSGRIHAFDADSGHESWVLPPVARLRDEQDFRPLAVSGNVLVAGSLSGEVVAHDLKTHRVLWRRTPSMASVAFSLAAHAGVAYVPYFSDHIVALRVRDGAELWRIGGGASRFRWTPFVSGALLAASGAQSISLFRHGGEGSWRRP